MRQRIPRHSRIGLVLLWGLISMAAVMPQPPSEGASRDGLAAIAKKGKRGKIIAAPRFEVPEHMLAPPRPVGSTVSFTITGRLVMRGCFTSASTDGRKVKCSGAVQRACVAGRTIEVKAARAQVPRQVVTAAADGSFTATVVFEDDYLEAHLLVAPIRTRSRGLKIACYPLSFSVDISEARP